MKRILLTGASGFIGKNVILSLQASGYEVIPVVSSFKKLVGEVKPIACSLLDPKAVSELCEEVKASHLLHLAWHSDHKTLYESELNWEWTQASVHLVREFVKNGGTRAVVAGSCAEYNWQNSCYSENDLDPQALTAYGRSKNELRRLLNELTQQPPYSLGWARIFFVYGTYEPLHKLVASAISHLLKGIPFSLQNGQLVRDYLHVKDVADALVLFLSSTLEGVVNISSEEGHSLDSILRIIEKELQVKAASASSANQPSSQPLKIVAQGSRLKTELGWQKRYSLEEGLSEAVNWWKKHLELKS